MAAYLAESAAEPGALPGQTEFVALFSQGTCGNVIIYICLLNNPQAIVGDTRFGFSLFPT